MKRQKTEIRIQNSESKRYVIYSVFCLLFSVFCLLSSIHAQTTTSSFDPGQQEIVKYYQGLYQLQTDYQPGGKIARIIDRLNKAYGTNFRVIPGQTGRAAMAFGRGIIVLDLSMSGGHDEETIAGLLAHEWAHDYLGHLYTLQYGYLQAGANPYTQLDANRKLELEADCVGTQHLIKAGYSPYGFIRLIIEKGDIEAFKHPNLRMYYPPQARLRAIYDCSQTILNRKSRHEIENLLGLTPYQKLEQTACIHKITCIHTRPCEHTLQCQHICQDIYTGQNIPCHLYDTQHQYDTEHPHDTEHLYDPAQL